MSEQNSSVNVDEFLAKKHSLNEILGDGWVERCSGGLLKSVLSEDEQKAIELGVEPALEGDDSKENAQALWLKTIFDQNHSPYRVLLTEQKDGTKQIVAVGTINGDVVIQFISHLEVFESKDGNKLAKWIPKKFFVSGEGGVIKLHELVANANQSVSGKNIDLVFYADSNDAVRKYVSGGMDSLYAHSKNPVNIDSMARVLHEIGHALRKRALSAKEMSIQDELVVQGNRVNKTQKLFHKENTHSNYQLRKYRADEERGAWAVPISILRELGKYVNLNITSKDTIDELLQIAERSLETYDY